MPSIPVIIVSMFFFSSGLSHFLWTDFYVQIMPSYLAYPLELVQLSGILALLGAIGLLIPQARKLSAYGLMCLCVAVFPANINMALYPELFPTIPLALLYFRLPLQALFIWSIWFSVREPKFYKANYETYPDVQNNFNSEHFCQEIRKDSIGLLSWGWDARYGTILASFGADNEENVRQLLKRYFPDAWDSATVRSVEPIAKKVPDAFANVKPGQLLFTSDVNQENFIYCALWPWGNKKTISLRISPANKKLNEKEKIQQMSDLKQWFKVDDSNAVAWS